MEELLRFLAVAALILGTIPVSYLGSLSGHIGYNPQTQDYTEYTVSELLDKLPLGQYVSVSGTVSRVEGDYTSKKGYEYQAFFMSDGSGEVKVFCSKYRGPADVSQGDQVSLKGVFQEYYQEYEIYLYCSDIGKRD